MPLPVASESTVIRERQRFYIMPQAASGTLGAPGGADPTTTTGGPCRVLESDFAVSIQKELHGFSQDGARDFVGSTYEKMREIPWTIKTRIAPPRNLSGTVVPETHHLMAAIFGRSTYAGSEIQYLTDDKRRGSLLSLARLVNFNDRIFGEWLVDAIPNSVKFDCRGGEPPTLEFAGEAAQHIGCASTTLAAAMSSTDEATITHGNIADPGARVSIGSEDGSGAGLVVTSNAGTALVIGSSISAADGAEVRPFMPDPTYSDQPALGAIEGGITIDGLQVPAQGFSVTVDWGTEYIRDEWGSSGLTDGVPGKQAITGEVVLRATESAVRRIVQNKRFATGAFAVAFGDGSTLRDQNLTAANVEFWVDRLSVDRVGALTIPFRCLDSTDGARDALIYSVA